MAAEQIMQMEFVTVPIDAISPLPGNARRGDHSLIRASLNEHGQYRPLIVQRSTGHIIAGNNTYAVARADGWANIAVQYVDLPDAEARRIALRDNRINDHADYDDKLLLELLADQPDLDDIGFPAEDIDELLRTTNTLGDAAAAWLEPARNTPTPGGIDIPDPAPGQGGAGVPRITTTATATVPPPPEPVIPGTDLVPVQWTVTTAERDQIRAGLRALQQAWDLQTGSETLVAVIARATEQLELENA